MSVMFNPQVATYEADGVIAKGNPVKIGTTNKRVAVGAATTDECIGIAQNATTTAGDIVEVAMPGGGGKALANATIAAGDELGINANGKVQKVASANDRVIGYALESAVSGDIFSVIVQLGVAKQTQS